MEIGIWGDSITYGECDSECHGWVGRLRKSFSVDDYVGVYNRGVCGDTTKDLLERFLVEAESLQPNKIVFALGINDSKYTAGETENKVPLGQFKDNMRLLIKQAKTFTDNIFVVSATKVDERDKGYSGTRFVNDDIQAYNSFLKELSAEEKITFLDVFNILTASDLYDGLHPNAGGYEKLFITIKPKLTI